MTLNEVFKELEFKVYSQITSGLSDSFSQKVKNILSK